MSAPVTHSPVEEHRRRALQIYKKYFVYENPYDSFG